MARVAIFGDIGGHVDAFTAQLVRLGMDRDTLRLPDDLVVIQVGDLVHRGPDSTGVLALVEQMLTRYPDQWHQLSGNHEAQYLRRPRFAWPERLPKPERERLRAWWADGRMRVAAAVRGVDGEQLLVTHAGITAPVWRQLGAPATADDAAAAVNALIPDDPRLWRAGIMLEGATSLLAGPWWAEAASELYTSWGMEILDGDPLPFSQVHGHSNTFDYRRQTYSRHLPQHLRSHVKTDNHARHTTLTVPGGRIVGVDPGHSGSAARVWAPLVLDGAAVTS